MLEILLADRHGNQRDGIRADPRFNLMLEILLADRMMRLSSSIHSGCFNLMLEILLADRLVPFFLRHALTGFQSHA